MLQATGFSLRNSEIQAKQILQKLFLLGGSTETVHPHIQSYAARILLDVYFSLMSDLRVTQSGKTKASSENQNSLLYQKRMVPQ